MVQQPNMLNGQGKAGDGEEFDSGGGWVQRWGRIRHWLMGERNPQKPLLLEGEMSLDGGKKNTCGEKNKTSIMIFEFEL